MMYHLFLYLIWNRALVSMGAVVAAVPPDFRNRDVAPTDFEDY